MIELSNVRARLSWPLILIFVMYLLAVVIVFAIYFPAKNKNDRLVTDLEQLARTEETLKRIAAEKPALERETKEQKKLVAELTRQIPTQYDLPSVLGFLEQLAVSYNLKLESLNHVPVKNGIIPLTLELQGGDTIYPYLLELQATLPSLLLTEVDLRYQGNRTFSTRIKADLQVLVVEHASSSNFVLARAAGNHEGQQLKGYGLPFATVAKFLDKQVQVYGVVVAGEKSSALIGKAGVKRWLKVGERLDEAVVSRIHSNGVTLNVDGILLNLTIGG